MRSEFLFDTFDLHLPLAHPLDEAHHRLANRHAVMLRPGHPLQFAIEALPQAPLMRRRLVLVAFGVVTAGRHSLCFSSPAPHPPTKPRRVDATRFGICFKYHALPSFHSFACFPQPLRESF